MPRRRVTPKTLVLDLLRVSERSISIRALIAVGELFEFQSTAVRVAVTRLVQEGLVTSNERGSYELAAGTTPLTAHVEQWRLGEARLRRWSGDWVVVGLGRGESRSARRRSLRALELLGFRQGLTGLWVRPDNLTASLPQLVAKLEALGLEDGAEPFIGARFGSALIARWSATLWDKKALAASYRDALSKLERSAKRLQSLPLERALVETFDLGGAAIRILATDPLLPEAILPGSDRAALSEAMLKYDELGRGVWNRLVGTDFDAAPAHTLGLTTGAA